MKKRKGLLQKASLIFGVISFILAAVCGVLFYIRVDEVGGNNPISASLLASIFFFIFVGIILTIIGRSDLPSFKLDDSSKE